MSKIIDNRLLERIGNPKKLIEQSLENQIRQVEAGLGEDASSLISKTLLLFIPKEGKYLQLHETEIEKKLLANQNISSSKIQNVLSQLKEVGILTSTENGQYEFASAVLANHIYEKIEAENRVLRKVETFIHDRFATYQENKNWLNQDDLNYINPYLSTISISSDEVAFIENSKAKIIRKRRQSRTRTILIIIVLAFFGFGSFLGSIFLYNFYKEADLQKRELDVIAQKLRLAEKDEIAKNELLENKNKELDEAKRKAEQESEDNKKLATENKELAQKFQAEADRNDAIARKATIEKENAEYQKSIADEKVLENKELAKKAEAEAAINAALAKQNADLNAIILSRNIAKQATQLDDKETELKALLAKEAFQINVDSEENGDINHPDIYNALYDGLKSLNKQENNENFNQINNERGAVRSIVFDESGNVFYTIGSSGILKKWEVTKWNAIDKPEVNQTVIDRISEVQNVLEISADNKWLVVGGTSKNIRLYDMNDIKKVPRLLNHHDGQEVFDIVFVPDNSGFVSSGADKTLQFYTIKDSSVKKIATTQTRVEVISITAQKPYLLYYGTVEGKLFEQEINGLPLQLEPNLNKEPLQRITAIQVTQYDQKKVLAIGYIDGLVKIFQADFGTFPVNRGGTLIYNSSKLHSTRIADLTFNEKKQQLGIASYDGTASLWDLTVTDLRQYQPILFDNEESWVMSFAFSKQNNQILIGNRDGAISFFNPDPTVYADEICSKIDRSLNSEEWRQYFGTDLTFRKTCP